MKINRIVLRDVAIPLRTPFTTSFGTITDKPFYVVEASCDGETGYGECAALTSPIYNEESVSTCRTVTEEDLIPLLRTAGDISHPSEIRKIFAPIRRNNIAKAAIEEAVWDLWCKLEGISLSKALGGTRAEVDAGVSIGMQKTPEDLVRVTGAFLEEGYRRVKVKIAPGRDIRFIEALRKEFGDIPLQVDANSAYSLSDIDVFREIDRFGLLLIEQPLAHDDIIDHRKLQAEIRTPVCLDESIDSLDDARHAIELGSCRIINIKVARVGGLAETKRIHDYCLAHGVGVWCGGMLDTGIGKAFNIASASLPGYTCANDITPSLRNFRNDFVDPLVTMEPNGTVKVPEAPGIGFAINRPLYEACTRSTRVFRMD